MLMHDGKDVGFTWKTANWQEPMMAPENGNFTQRIS